MTEDDIVRKKEASEVGEVTGVGAEDIILLCFGVWIMVLDTVFVIEELSSEAKGCSVLEVTVDDIEELIVMLLSTFGTLLGCLNIEWLAVFGRLVWLVTVLLLELLMARFKCLASMLSDMRDRPTRDTICIAKPNVATVIFDCCVKSLELRE